MTNRVRLLWAPTPAPSPPDVVDLPHIPDDGWNPSDTTGGITFYGETTLAPTAPPPPPADVLHVYDEAGNVVATGVLTGTDGYGGATYRFEPIDPDRRQR